MAVINPPERKLAKRTSVHIVKSSLAYTTTPDLKLLVIDATGISPYPMCHELSSADILAIGVSKCTLDLLLNDPLKSVRLSPD